MENALSLYIYLLTAVSILYLITCLLINKYYIFRQEEIQKYSPVVTVYKKNEVIPCDNFLNLSFSRPINTSITENQNITSANSVVSSQSSDEVEKEIINPEYSNRSLQSIYCAENSVSRSSLNNSFLDTMKSQNTKDNFRDKVSKCKESYCKSKYKSNNSISNENDLNCVSNELRHVSFHKPCSAVVEKKCPSRRSKCKSKSNIDYNNEKELSTHFPKCPTTSEYDSLCPQRKDNKKKVEQRKDKSIDVSIISHSNIPIRSTVSIKQKSPTSSESNRNTHKITQRMSKNGDNFKVSTTMTKSNNSVEKDMKMTESEEERMKTIEFDNKINELKNRCRNLVTDSDFSAELEKIGQSLSAKIYANINECGEECKNIAARHNSRDRSVEKNSNENYSIDNYSVETKLRSNRSNNSEGDKTRSRSFERYKNVDDSSSTSKNLERVNSTYCFTRSDDSIEIGDSRKESRDFEPRNSSYTSSSCQRNGYRTDMESDSDRAVQSKSNRRQSSYVTESNSSLEMNICYNRQKLAETKQDKIKYSDISVELTDRDRGRIGSINRTNNTVTDSNYSVQMNNILCASSLDSNNSTEMGNISYGKQTKICRRAQKPAFITESDTSIEMSTFYKPEMKRTNKKDLATDTSQSPEMNNISTGSCQTNKQSFSASEFSLELAKLCDTCSDLIKEAELCNQMPLKTSTPKRSKRESGISIEKNRTCPNSKTPTNTLETSDQTKEQFEDDLKFLQQKYFGAENDVNTNSGMVPMREQKNSCVCAIVQKHISTSTTIIPYNNVQPQLDVDTQKVETLCRKIISKPRERPMQADAFDNNNIISRQSLIDQHSNLNIPALRPEYKDKFPCTQKGLHEIFDSVLELQKRAEKCLMLTEPSACKCSKSNKLISRAKLRIPYTAPKLSKIRLKINNKGSTATATKVLGVGNSNKIRLRITTKPKRKKSSECKCPRLEITECVPNKDLATDEEQYYVPKVLMQSRRDDSSFRRSVSECRPTPCSCACSRTSCSKPPCKPDSVLTKLSQRVEDCLERAKKFMQSPKKKSACDCIRSRSESPRRTSQYYGRSQSPKLSTKHVFLPDRDELAAKYYNKHHNITIRSTPCPYAQSGSTSMSMSQSNRSRSSSPSSNDCKCYSRTPKPTNKYCRC